MDQHYVASTLGAVDVKVTHSTQGIAVEIDAKRPREPGESAEAAARASVEWALIAYGIAVEALTTQGLAPGPFKKPS